VTPTYEVREKEKLVQRQVAEELEQQIYEKNE
jgi:hypothetical protein